MRRLLIALALASMPTFAHAQCTNEIDVLATSLAQARSDLGFLQVRFAVLKNQVGSQGQQLREVRDRLYPAFYRGPGRLEQILAEVEKDLPPME